MNAKRILTMMVVGCGCLAVAYQQQQPKKYVLLDDKKGEFKIYDVESFENNYKPEEGQFEFSANGSPLKGYSKTQGLTFSMRSLVGTATRSEGGTFRIDNAKASNDVVAQIEQRNTDGSTARSHIETGSMTLVEGASQSTITFPSAFTFANRIVSESVDRLIEIKAPSGTFVLPLLSQTSGSNNPFKSADVRGPVQITIDSKRKTAKGPASDLLKLSGDHLTYDGATRTMVLAGNVVADVDGKLANGDDYGFVTQYQSITIEFDENSAIKKFGGKAGTLSGKGGGV